MPPPAAPPLAGITRTSHTGTRKADSETFHAFEDERAAIERYAHELRREVVFLEPELDVKGSWPIERRPSLRAGIEGVEQGVYGGLIFGDIKRATRSRSGFEIWDRVERRGGYVFTAAERLDTSTPHGRHMRDHYVSLAVLEREEHAVRHANRRQKTVEAGIWRQRQTPTGYEFAGPADHDGRYRGRARKLVPSSRAGDVLAAFEAAAAGEPITVIGRRLGMTYAGARALLSNRVYLGELREGGIEQDDGTVSPLHVNPAAHDPIPGLTVELFERVQRRLRYAVRAPRATTLPPSLLQGLVVCASCSHAMSRRKTSAVVYGCHREHSGGKCPAPASIKLELLDEHVGRLVRERAAGFEVDLGVDPQARLAEVQAELESARSARGKAVARLVRAGLDEDDPDARRPLAELDAEIARLEQREIEVAATVPAAASFQDGSRTIETEQDLRDAVAAFVGHVVVRPAGRGSRVPIAERVTVVRFGVDLGLARRRGGEALPIEPVDLSRLDRDDVLGVLADEKPA